MKKQLLFCLLLFLICKLSGQDSTAYVIAFYNVENLFNPSDDSLTNDDAFTPIGLNHWTFKKYLRKINNISKVLLAMNEWSPPDIIGVAEIEDRSVLNRFCYDSPLKKYNYHCVHYDSPDRRGVDVGLLYRSDRIRIRHSEPIPVVFPFDSATRNRDILYVVAQFPNGDSIHLFINHWTSRYGGFAPTIPKRNYYAAVMKTKTDSILQTNPSANILITGDFNDYLSDESIHDILQAGNPDDQTDQNCHLFDLMYRFLKMQNIGTHKHEDFWGCLDQFMVSAPLLSAQNRITIIAGEAHIFKADFMVEPDEKYGGYKVYRTFLGPRYIGGYADHLPIFVRLRLKYDDL